MRKPSLSETIVIAYAGYMWFTLSVDPNWLYQSIEENPDSMYAAYLNFLGSQFNVAMFSLLVAILMIIVLFFQNYTLRIAANLVGLIYFTILSASYVFSYPNLGLGLALIFTTLLVANINRLIDEQQEVKKHKIICDSYDEGGDN